MVLSRSWTLHRTRRDSQTSERGLHVVSSGTNPRTDKPAFVRTLGQEDDTGSGVPGAQERVKWLAFVDHQASTGFPGFDAVPGQELICETWMLCRTYGTNAPAASCTHTDYMY
jgi:hypothetical protein